MRYTWNLSASLLGAATTIALVQPVAQALTSAEIGNLARAVTVRIEAPGASGSGFIIEQEAIVNYSQAIPNDAEAYFNSGLSKYKVGDYQGAIVDFNQAIRLNPNYAEAYNHRGITKATLGDYQGAIVDYNKAIELNSNDAAAYYGRGLTYQQLGENQQALADFREAARLYQQQGDTTGYQNANDRIRQSGG